MMSKSIATTLRAGAIAALLVVSSAAAAFAAPIVTFQTTGQFASTGTSSVMFSGGGGSATLTFAGIPFGLVDTPSTTSLGTMVMSAGEPGFTGNVSGEGFTLFINQLDPAGTGQLLGTVSGTIASNNQSTFRLLFSTDTVTIAGVTYDLQQPNEGYFLVPPTTNSGTTSIQAFVTAQQTPPPVVPEPASMVLLGTGLLAAFKARRHMAQKNAQ